MKQGEAARVSLDLDDLERQLSAAAGPRRSGSDDPLAELARIVGYNDQGAARPAAKTAGSFDDFLVNPPRSVSEMMGAPSTRPAVLPPLPQAPASADPGLFEPPVAPAATVATPSVTAIEPQPEPVVQPQAAPEPTPLSLQEQLVAALGEIAPPLRPTLSIDERGAADPFAETRPQPVAHAVADRIELPAKTEAGQGQSSDPRFEEMLKEFDAAMRDVGAQPLQPAQVAPPPPETWAAPVVPASLAYDPDAETAATAAPAPAGRSRFGMILAGGVIGVALVGAAGLLAFGGGSRNATGGSAPVIAAKPGVTKEKPANPGGVEVPNQDKEILARAPATPQAERVAPREEQPVDLTQAQRSADAQTNAGGVRQIPGVLVLGPSASQPPAAPAAAPSPGAAPAAPAAPQPRPVASVPITISGQPPVATAPAPAVAPPAVPRPVAAAPAAPSAPAAPAAPVAPAPTAAAPVPAAATPAQPASGASQAASAEPRRVRAVPIRPDDGAPNRAQAQPRVVPAAPARPAAPAPSATAEADDTNAPLRITPQAVRSAPAQRSAAVSPAAVPGSTAAPVTTQSTTPDAVPSSGGSFSVQIGAEGTQDAAQAKFNRMRAQHSGVLGGASPTIRSAEVNGRSVYRVRVGQMSREEAVSLCERLKADGGSCFVARN